MVLAIELDINLLFFWDPILFEDTPFAINRVALLMLGAAFACIAFFLYGAAKKALVPKGGQNLAETAYLFVREKIAVDVIGPKDGPKFAGYLASIFFFILFMNLLAVIPGIHFAPTSRMAIPFMLAILTWIIFNV